jgi:hypothetical protein
VIDRFGGNPKGLADLDQFSEIVACDGFYSSDDRFRHAVVGTESGQITEIFYNPEQGLGRTVLATEGRLVDLAAFYTGDDHFRHVVTLSKSGDVREVFYSPEKGLGTDLLTNIAGAHRIAGFFSSDDSFRHAIVATNNGDIIEVFFNPNKGQGQTALAGFRDVIDIGDSSVRTTASDTFSWAQGMETSLRFSTIPNMALARSCLEIFPTSPGFLLTTSPPIISLIVGCR